MLFNPCVSVEVLWKSTERRDRGWTFDRYCEPSSLIDYILVSQETLLVEHFIRQSDEEWKLQRLKELEATLSLKAVPCEVPLREIFADVQFGPEDAAKAFG